MNDDHTATARALPAGEPLLRLALKVDAAVTGANGLAYLALAGPLEDLLGLPASFLRPVGAFLLLFAAAVAVVGTREELNPAAVIAVIAANVLWVVDSFALLAFGWHDPTTGGSIWIGLQAVTVALFVALQATGRRSS